MAPRFPDPDDRNELAADCRRCGELAASRTCISWGVGPLDASVVVVGEATAAGDPDAEQWRGGNLTGMAYTSRASGRKIRTLLANCRPYLVEEVETVAPRAVLPTGKHATETVLALDGETLDGFLDSALGPRASDALGVPVVPLLHPSYQEVWLSRLGYDYEAYVGEIRAAVARAVR